METDLGAGGRSSGSIPRWRLGKERKRKGLCWEGEEERMMKIVRGGSDGKEREAK